ncbi:23S rRNA (adenine(2503)-C(2))-methyltransferase RlmN [Fuerstiella marisgermanici]|uniref:Ribosomal RNA large subunit methyltransferase Cfr n=1 Tax=Fuerstiella marisgermanici TaxID=1891926 RepID=A0A1P8WRY4_9PLAN|nr:23S rRNA (adenine(2503)-C(2))-methyltransferase RlmN [Fuerstiella marisgermanici]APZ96811.1 Ribosomal RNA large subunit methyltransferase Cfr [Fuerstiella marisgermanici]
MRVLRNNLLKKFQPDDVALQAFVGRDRLRCHVLNEFQRCDSNIDGATKLLFQTSTGMLIESVILRIETGRTTLCVSSQIGCAAACDFCATGKMGIAQNLAVSEILDQVLQVGQLLKAEGRRLDNIVFMGMGEPFHNELNLHEALTILTSPQMFARSPGSILVSTVGVPEAMIRCAEQFPKVNLALSLHSVNPDVRANLIPLTKKHSLDDLQRTLKEVNRIQQRPLMVEYLMLADQNDSLADAAELCEWLHGMSVHVNLIPYNEIEDSPHLTGSNPDVITAFADQMKSADFKTTIRYSLGSDIAAACGQLVKKENRQRAIAINAGAELSVDADLRS